MILLILKPHLMFGKGNKTMYKEGMTIRINHMEGEPQYTGKTGTIDHVDDLGQLHGSWGGCALIPGTDDFEIIE